jgi:hypothetical protein
VNTVLPIVLGISPAEARLARRRSTVRPIPMNLKELSSRNIRQENIKVEKHFLLGSKYLAEKELGLN